MKWQHHAGIQLKTDVSEYNIHVLSMVSMKKKGEAITQTSIYLENSYGT